MRSEVGSGGPPSRTECCDSGEVRISGTELCA